MCKYWIGSPEGSERPDLRIRPGFGKRTLHHLMVRKRPLPGRQHLQHRLCEAFALMTRDTAGHAFSIQVLGDAEEAVAATTVISSIHESYLCTVFERACVIKSNVAGKRIGIFCITSFYFFLFHLLHLKMYTFAACPFLCLRSQAAR